VNVLESDVVTPVGTIQASNMHTIADLDSANMNLLNKPVNPATLSHYLSLCPRFEGPPEPAKEKKTDAPAVKDASVPKPVKLDVALSRGPTMNNQIDRKLDDVDVEMVVLSDDPLPVATDSARSSSVIQAPIQAPVPVDEASSLLVEDAIDLPINEKSDDMRVQEEKSQEKSQEKSEQAEDIEKVTEAQPVSTTKMEVEQDIRYSVRTKRNLILADYMQRLSKDATLVFMSMPVPDADLEPLQFMAWLDTISHGVQCPVVYIRGNQQTTLTKEL